MQYTNVTFEEQTRNELKEGARIVADAVRVTLGPRGSNVAIDGGFGIPIITNDGVSIARAINLENNFNNMGASILKEISTKTNNKAGDGTTTSIVIANSIIQEGFKLIEEGKNPVLLKKGIECATNDVLVLLSKLSRGVSRPKDILDVATISSESKELGKVIADTIEKVGKDSIVTVEYSNTIGISSEVKEGMEVDAGYLSPYMVTDHKKQEASFDNVMVLVTDKNITQVKSIIPIIEKLKGQNIDNLVVFAEGVDGEALAALVANKIKGTFNTLAVNIPGYGETKVNNMNDIAVMVGAKVLSDATDNNIEQADIADLGSADKIVSTQDKTLITGGKVKEDELNDLLAMIDSQIEGEDRPIENGRMKERMAKLKQGVAVIKVGAPTETEMKYLADKIEDAVHATKAAIEEGIVAGGGATLLEIAERMEKESMGMDEHDGYNLVVNALRKPFAQILENAGVKDCKVITGKVIDIKYPHGYDASGESITDMIEAGIIDPVKVTRNAIINASSAAAVLLTTKVAIAQYEVK